MVHAVAALGVSDTLPHVVGGSLEMGITDDDIWESL
jgi:hypothetical protein